MKRLCLNADDFGLSPGVSEGIVDAMVRGVVGTTTAMLGSDAGTANISPLADAIAGRIGLHLQLTNGRPCLPPAEVPSLVDDAGRFPPRRAAIRQPNPTEVAREFRAQLERCAHWHRTDASRFTSRRASGAVGLRPLRRVRGGARSARAAGVDAPRNLLRARGVRCADHFTTRFEAARTGVDDLLAILEDCGRIMADGELLEVMCHPGRPDDLLAERSRYVVERGRELETLLEPDLDRRIAMIGFRLLRNAADD